MYFDVLLTVHLSIFISVINQLDAQNFCFTISLFHAPTCFKHHVLIIRRSKLHYTVLSQPVRRTATYRCDVTRGCVMQFWPPDDEHMCSKHVEAWNKLIVKQKCCASSWLITEINIYVFFYVFLCRLFCCVYCLCVNVYCTTATGCPPNCI